LDEPGSLAARCWERRTAEGASALPLDHPKAAALIDGHAGDRVAAHQVEGVEGRHQRIDLRLAGRLLGDQHGIAALLSLRIADAPRHERLTGVPQGPVLELSLHP